MIYANPVPADLISGEYYDKKQAGYYLSPDKLESDYAPVRFERELRLFRRYCNRGSILDVGCSTGGFLNELRRRWPGDYEVMGTDASGPALDCAAAKGIPVRRGDFVQLGFKGEDFDAVTFWAVLEHVAEPKIFLRRARELLKPEGFCFVLVPNMRSLAARVLGARYRYIYPEHLNYFTPQTLGRLVGNEFEVVETRTTHFNPLVVWQDLRQGSAQVLPPERARLLRRTTAYKQNPWLGPARFVYHQMETLLVLLGLADNLVMVLRKRADASGR
jgi:2-polyprenyl-3-methyl-5-hydroxy-6-metoxy-1,4-benzoquinol methylase